MLLRDPVSGLVWSLKRVWGDTSEDHLCVFKTFNEVYAMAIVVSDSFMDPMMVKALRDPRDITVNDA